VHFKSAWRGVDACSWTREGVCARRRRQITARGFFDLFMNIFNIGVLFFFVFVSGKNE
jgi:hypothetical protein